MENPVVARREGTNAILRCSICGNETTVSEGRFDLIHQFLQKHTTCAGVPAS